MSRPLLRNADFTGHVLKFICSGNSVFFPRRLGKNPIPKNLQCLQTVWISPHAAERSTLSQTSVRVLLLPWSSPGLRNIRGSSHRAKLTEGCSGFNKTFSSRFSRRLLFRRQNKSLTLIDMESIWPPVYVKITKWCGERNKWKKNKDYWTFPAASWVAADAESQIMQEKVPLGLFTA